MLRRSLTGKILVAVGVTVAVVIAIYTYFVIRVQSAWWHERTQAQNLLTASIVHEHLQRVMLGGRGEEVQSFLLELKISSDFLCRVFCSSSRSPKKSPWVASSNRTAKSFFPRKHRKCGVRSTVPHRSSSTKIASCTACAATAPSPLPSP